MGALSASNRDRLGEHSPCIARASGRGLLGLTVLLATLLVNGDARGDAPHAGKAPSLVATASPRAKSFASEVPAATIAGFRMEGGPRLEMVFGDIAAYKKQIDEFSRLVEEMDGQRQRFATSTHRIQKALGPRPRHQRRTEPKLSRTCPVDTIAIDVASATQAHERFRHLGVSMEAGYQAIRDLHQLGESTGLTPDYRSRVVQSRAVYRQALSDLSEMNAVLRLQLNPELQTHGCKPDELIAEANLQTQVPPALAPELAPEGSGVPTAGPPVVEARAVTFFVDNRSCSEGLDVYVDATLLGRVAAGTQTAFQSLSGRHSLCLLEEGNVASCGDTGTVRTAFLHDGFQIERTCSRKQRALSSSPPERPGPE